MVASLEPGAILDGFIIGECIHSGGMATLWSARKPGVEAPLLIKTPKLAEDATAIVGFEMEMMILPRLVGAHAPHCYAVGDYGAQPYIAMERIAGQSLLDRLDEAPLPPSEVAAIGAKIAEALTDIHRQNVLHLDVKPSNVMIRDTGAAALIDFGLSRHLLLPDLLQEEFEVPIGTGPYISPEQLRKIRSDPRSDLFSLGVLLYHFATKTRPFGYPKSQQGLNARLWRDPVPPRALAPDTPPWLQEVILRCLEPDPNERYPSAAQLLFALKNPASVALTARAHKLRRDPLAKSLKRWFLGAAPAPDPTAPPPGSIASAPIVMAAIDVQDDDSGVLESMRAHVARVLATAAHVRLACVNVLRQPRLSLAYEAGEQGDNPHVQRLVALKAWALPLGLAADRATFHVLENADPAQALIDYARANHVDHILIASSSASFGLRRLVGDVAAKVAAEAPCTVTIVRAPADRAS